MLNLKYTWDNLRKSLKLKYLKGNEEIQNLRFLIIMKNVESIENLYNLKNLQNLKNLE